MENLKWKRERSVKYSKKCILLEIVIRFCGVIESKKIDGVSNKLKNQEWINISEEFATTSSTYTRNYQSLKTLWQNLKRKAKMAIAAQAENLYHTDI